MYFCELKTKSLVKQGTILNIVYKLLKTHLFNHLKQSKMKKIFTLCIALLAMSICVKAQIVLTENFDSGMPSGWTQIDANNDGMGWEHSSNPASYFPSTVDLSGSGHNGSTAFMLSGSYSNVTSTAITPDNWLITPAINLTANSTLTFYVCAQDASYASEHYGVYISTTNATSTSAFTMLNQWTIGSSKTQSPWEEKTVDLSAYTGQTVYIAFRHFNCNDQFLLNLDDVTIMAQPTSPTIIANPTSIDFGTVVLGQNSAAATSVISTYLLTSGVTATTAAPFSVSADGSTFGTTATLDTAGGTLYMRYSPTAAGAATGNVTLSSTGATNVTITLTGNGVDCSNITLPVNETFDNLSSCWSYFAADAANSNVFGPYAHSTLGNVFRFNSFATATDYTQYLITPMLPGNDEMLMTFEYTGYSTSSSETFMVGTSTTTNDLSAFTWGPEISAPATTSTYSATLPAGTKYAAIKYTSEYLYYLYIDNVNISVMPTTPTFNIQTNTLNFGTIVVGATKDLNFPVTAYALADDITVTAAAPFSVSSNGTTYGTTATIAHTSGTTQGTVYVRYAPTAPGNQTGNVTLTSGALTHTVAVSGSAIDCNVPATLPFTEDFESDLTECWQNVDNDGDGYTWGQYSYSPHTGDYSYASASWVSGNVLTPDNWLITPTLVIPSNGATLKWFVAAQDADYPDEYYEVRVSTNGTTLSNFTTVFTETLTTDQWEERTVSLANYAGQNVNIAFVHTNSSDVFMMKIDDISVTAGVGINEVETSTSIYPNPANNILNINASSNINKVEVYNMLGQNVMTVSVNDINTSINTSNLSEGMYMLKLHTDNGIVNKKFTVAR